MQTIIFELDGRSYALPLERVEEVTAAARIISLPEALEFVEGVVDLRGHAIPVLDVRKRFRLPEKPVVTTDRFIIGQASGRRVIIRADAILGLRAIASSDVTSTQDISPTLRYVAGVACLSDGIVLIHDLDTFLVAFEHDLLDRALAGLQA